MYKYQTKAVFYVKKKRELVQSYFWREGKCLKISFGGLGCSVADLFGGWSNLEAHTLLFLR